VGWGGGRKERVLYSRREEFYQAQRGLSRNLYFPFNISYMSYLPKLPNEPAYMLNT
jgi:hypothetical protein